MNLLAIDTSTTRASVAIFVNNTLYTEGNDNLRQHANHLLPMINTLLNKAQIKLSSLDGIAFGSGPGSFTGLRVTCSVVQALAYATDLPVYPVSSLQAIAYQASLGEIGDDEGVLAVIDARMDELYWGFFTDFLNDDLKVSKAQFIDVPSDKKIILAGVGFEGYTSQLSAGVKAAIKKTREIYPEASSMLSLVQKNYIKPITALEVLPVYIRNQVVRG